MQTKSTNGNQRTMKTSELVRRFLPYFRPYRGMLALDLFCAMLTTLCDLVLPMIVRSITGLASSSAAAGQARSSAAADGLPPRVSGVHGGGAHGAASRRRAGGNAALRHGHHTADVPCGVVHRATRRGCVLRDRPAGEHG